MGPGSADFIHTVTECAKLAFADREAWYGDPDFTDVPVKALLSAEYADARRGLVGPRGLGRAAPGLPGRPAAPAAGLRHRASDPAEPRAAARRGSTRAPASRPCAAATRQARPRRATGRGDTCHLDVADRFGNMVSATPSGGWLQSSPVIPGLGFCLGTRAQMFTLTPGLPATLAPGKRPRTTLTPQPGAEGPRALPGLRHPRRRPAGSVVAAVLPQPRAGRDEPAAGHRLPGLPLRAHAVVVLPAPGPARACSTSSRGSIRGRDRGPAPPRPPGQRPAAWSLGRVSAVARRDGMLYAAANPRGMQGYAAGR